MKFLCKRLISFNPALVTLTAAASPASPQNGVERNQFIEIHNSFAIDTFTRAAVQLQSLFQVNSVPMIAIDGRYLTSLAMTAKGIDRNASEFQFHEAPLQVMDTLVAKAKKERGTINPVKSVVRK